MNNQPVMERRSAINEIVLILKMLESIGDKDGQNFVLVSARMAAIQAEQKKTA